MEHGYPVLACRLGYPFEVLSSPGAGEDEMLFTVAQNCHHYARALRNPHTPPEFFPAEFRQAVFSLDAEYAIAAHGTLHTDALTRIERAARAVADFNASRLPLIRSKADAPRGR
ncbi:MAG: hypothetical protein E6G05_02910 [Actinobacteria bacterium]|nr:MAG: hypothetical protein E6G05_02910 [Actinomycetota bacterium]